TELCCFCCLPWHPSLLCAICQYVFNVAIGRSVNLSGHPRPTKKRYTNRSARRTFMKTASMAAGALCLGGCAEMQNSSSTPPPVISKPEGIAVNDIHSQLNSTFVHEVLKPASVEECRLIIQKASDDGRVISV